jgi:outer membrane PBP1 activator LpoA protein
MLQLHHDVGKVAPNFERTNPMRSITAMVIAALLAGCSLFSTTTSWTKPGVTPEKAQADLDTCKQVAWEQQSADERIDQDTSATMNDSANGAVDTELSQNMSNQRSGKRYGSIVDDCMRQLGYAPAN